MPHAPPARPAGRPPDDRPFVGRTAELAQLGALLARARLVTITGPGGVGKTRLAQRAAAQSRTAGQAPVAAVGLSGVTDPRLLPHAIAARLGLAEQDTTTARDRVLRYLRDQKMLLILDTCEHLLDDCAVLTEAVLRETDGVTILATSRQPLDVAGENILPLTPLPVPADGDDPATAGQNDAAGLFARLAARVVPGFAITPANAADVITVCRRLDGIPLAIELAAARLRTMSVAELARQPTVLEPGGTLDRALAWSYQLCDQAERALWERLSVFAGPVTVEAAEEVCAGRDLPREHVLEAVIGLVDKSVLARDPGDGLDSDPGGGPAQFRLLDTVREFGGRRLASSGAGSSVRRRFIDRYLNRARDFRDRFLDEDQASRLAALRRGHANLQAALGYCLDDGACPATGAELATALFGYWQSAGLQLEGTLWMDRVLERFPEDGPERARALGVRCYLGTTAGEGQRAVADGRESVRLARALGDEPALARGYLYLCHALTVAEDYPAAMEAGRQAESLLGKLGDGIGLRILAAHMAHACQLAGNLDDADAWYRRGLRLWGRTDERWSTGWLHLIGGYTFLQQGRLDECAAAWRLALHKKHSIGDVVGTGFALEAFSLLAVAQGHDTRAAWLFGAAEPMWERAGAMLSANRPLTDLRTRTYEEVRSRLGARRFDALYGQGSRCSLPTAVETATSDSGDVALPSGPAGARALTPREAEVAELAVTGLSNREIAERMTVSKRTVDTHIEHIYAKAGVSSRVQLARWLRDRTLGLRGGIPYLRAARPEIIRWEFRLLIPRLRRRPHQRYAGTRAGTRSHHCRLWQGGTIRSRVGADGPEKDVSPARNCASQMRCNLRFFCGESADRLYPAILSFGHH